MGMAEREILSTTHRQINILSKITNNPEDLKTVITTITPAGSPHRLDALALLKVPRRLLLEFMDHMPLDSDSRLQITMVDKAHRDMGAHMTIAVVVIHIVGIRIGDNAVEVTPIVGDVIRIVPCDYHHTTRE